jgi:chemotaxis protein CheY-P-specific phosphatase CheC
MREPQAMISPAQVDALRQLAGLGSTDAVRSLGHLLGTAVEGTKVRSHFAGSASLAEVLGAQGPAFAAHFTVEGGARLRVLIYFTVEGATLMAGLLLGTPLSERSALYSSALAEACNILVSSYVGGVGAGVGLTLVPSIPHVAIGELEQAIAAAFGDLETPLLLVTDLRLPGVRFAGRIVAAPDGEGLHRLLSGMGAA